MKLFFTVVLVCAAARAMAAPAVEWQDAPRCAGRRCTVHGTVAAQEEANGVIRLYFDRERRDVSVLLVRSLFTSWPSYVGQEIAVTGMVRKFRKQYEVVARRPRDIAIAGAATPLPAAEPTPAAARVPQVGGVPPTVAPTPQGAEVERLRRRVEELEGRVRELEGGAN